MQVQMELPDQPERLVVQAKTEGQDNKARVERQGNLVEMEAPAFLRKEARFTSLAEPSISLVMSFRIIQLWEETAEMAVPAEWGEMVEQEVKAELAELVAQKRPAEMEEMARLVAPAAMEEMAERAESGVQRMVVQFGTMARS